MLTPAHLLLGRRLLSTFEEECELESESDSVVVLTKRMKYIKSLSDHYWQRFTDEYLLELRTRHIQGKDPLRKPEVGEVVVIDSKAKRNAWRVGKVITLIPSPDGCAPCHVVGVYTGFPALCFVGFVLDENDQIDKSVIRGVFPAYR